MASSLRTDEEIIEIYNRHVDTVYRVCFSFMKNVTASNLCRDSLKKWWRRNENIEDYSSSLIEMTHADNEILDAILTLPNDYKCVVYMYYYEGYTTPEIADFLHCPQATVRSRLSRARKQLSFMLGGER